MSNLYPAANAYPVIGRRESARISTGASATLWTLSGIALAACGGGGGSSSPSPSRTPLPDSAFTSSPDSSWPNSHHSPYAHPESGADNDYDQGVDQVFEIGGIRIFANTQKDDGTPYYYNGYVLTVMKTDGETATVVVNRNPAQDMLPTTTLTVGTAATQETVRAAWEAAMGFGAEIIPEQTVEGAWLDGITVDNTVLTDFGVYTDEAAAIMAINRVTAEKVAELNDNSDLSTTFQQIDFHVDGGPNRPQFPQDRYLLTISETANSPTETNNDLTGRVMATDADGDAVVYGLDFFRTMDGGVKLPEDTTGDYIREGVEYKHNDWIVQNGTYGAIRLHTGTGEWVYRLGVSESNIASLNALDGGETGYDYFRVLGSDYAPRAGKTIITITVNGADEPAVGGGGGVNENPPPTQPTGGGASGLADLLPRVPTILPNTPGNPVGEIYADGIAQVSDSGASFPHGLLYNFVEAGINIDLQTHQTLYIRVSIPFANRDDTIEVTLPENIRTSLGSEVYWYNNAAFVAANFQLPIRSGDSDHSLAYNPNTGLLTFNSDLSDLPTVPDSETAVVLQNLNARVIVTFNYTPSPGVFIADEYIDSGADDDPAPAVVDVI